MERAIRSVATRTAGRIGVTVLSTVLIAGCILNEKEDNGTCNFGGPGTYCVPDATNNRHDYKESSTGGRGSVHATAGSDTDPIDLWVYKSALSGTQKLYAQSKDGCLTVFLRQCWFEPCDPGTWWHESWSAIWFTNVCEADGKVLVGTFEATVDAHFLVGITDWREMYQPDAVSYTFTLEQ